MYAKMRCIEEFDMEYTKPIYEDFNDFLKEHPEFPKAWGECAEASIIAEDDGIYGFIFGYLLV